MRNFNRYQVSLFLFDNLVGSWLSSEFEYGFLGLGFLLRKIIWFMISPCEKCYMIPYILKISAPVIYCCVTNHPKTQWCKPVIVMLMDGLCVRNLDKAWQGWFLLLYCVWSLARKTRKLGLVLSGGVLPCKSGSWCWLSAGTPTCGLGLCTCGSWVPRVSISRDRKRKLPVSKAWACKLVEHHFCGFFLSEAVTKLRFERKCIYPLLLLENHQII